MRIALYKYLLGTTALLATIGSFLEIRGAETAGADDVRPVTRFADSHVHLLDFLQNGEFLNADEEFPGVWEGIGEVMSRHDDLTNLTTGERPRANHAALARVCRFAGEHYLPVSIHHNIAPISRDNSEVKLPYYLDEFVQLIEYCRAGNGDCTQSTTFIWCHAGVSRRIVVKDLHFWIEEMLKSYGDQIFIDLSWVILGDYVLPNLEAWADLIGRYLDRFMIGSDVVGMVSRIDITLRPYDQLLSALPAEIRPKVAHDNFANLFAEFAQKRAAAELGENGIILPPAYEFSEEAHVQPRFKDIKFMDVRKDILGH